MSSLLNLLENATTIQHSLDRGQPVLLCGDRSQWDKLEKLVQSALIEANVVVYHVSVNPISPGEASETAVNLTGHKRQAQTQSEIDNAEAR